jgi:hypothetical protein
MYPASTGNTAPFIVIDTLMVERMPLEQDLHVLDRVDRHPRLADIATTRGWSLS